MKEQQCEVRRQHENFLLALHCLTTGHAFDWTRASAVEKNLTKSLLSPGVQHQQVLSSVWQLIHATKPYALIRQLLLPPLFVLLIMVIFRNRDAEIMRFSVFQKNFVCSIKSTDYAKQMELSSQRL